MSEVVGASKSVPMCLCHLLHMYCDLVRLFSPPVFNHIFTIMDRSWSRRTPVRGLRHVSPFGQERRQLRRRHSFERRGHLRRRLWHRGGHWPRRFLPERRPSSTWLLQHRHRRPLRFHLLWVNSFEVVKIATLRWKIFLLVSLSNIFIGLTDQ